MTPGQSKGGAAGSVKAGAWFAGQGAKPYIQSGKPWPSFEKMAKMATNLMDRIFDPALPEVRDRTAILTIGVMGSGKTTAIKQMRKRMGPSWRPALIDPDEIAKELLGRRKLPGSGSLYDLAGEWTHRIWKHAIRGGYNIVYDSPVPSEHLIRDLRRKGYLIVLLHVRTSQPTARGREVRRDMKRGWGRPGVSERSHLSAQKAVSRMGPRLARMCDRLTICDNMGKVMKCVDRGDPRRIADLEQEFRG